MFLTALSESMRLCCPCINTNKSLPLLKINYLYEECEEDIT